MQIKTIKRIEELNSLFSQYGSMTVRQIYYRLLGTIGLNYQQTKYICKVGRREGLISYSNIVDRSRPIYGKNLYDGLTVFLTATPDQFNLDFWNDSPTRPQIWTEKDALSQILLEIASDYNVDVYVTRGFLSISNKRKWGSGATILYFGDFDPSGLYIDEDLKLDVACEDFERIALTMDQVQKYDLPSVNVKRKDPRAPAYRAEYGDLGWELDALPPDVLKDLVRDSIEKYVDFNLEQKQEEEAKLRDSLYDLIENASESITDEESEGSP